MSESFEGYATVFGFTVGGVTAAWLDLSIPEVVIGGVGAFAINRGADWWVARRSRRETA